MKNITVIFLSLMTILILSVSEGYSMNTMKEWINKVKPGTFPETETKQEELTKAPPKKYTESEVRVLTALKDKEEALQRKEATLQKKEKELSILQQQLARKLNDIKASQEKIEKERKERQAMDEKDISKMVVYYEKMAPESSAEFFNQMDRVTATHLLMRMNPRKGSAILQLLDAKVAVEITEMVTRFKENRQQARR